MSSAREAFLRRYATSPIHVPRLERLLAVYDAEGGFAERFITWDRDCPDPEAARIVAEILSAGDAAGRLARLSDQAVHGAILWLSAPSARTVAERAAALQAGLRSQHAGEVADMIALLEAAAARPGDVP